MGKGKKGGKRLTKKQLVPKLEELFSSNPGKTMSFKEIFRSLHLDTHPLKMLAIDIMEEMAWDDFITKVSDNSYQLNQKGQVQEGVFLRKTNGKNTITPDGSDKPIFVAERNSMWALSGDRVRFSCMARRKNHIKEAQVIEILHRAKETFVGRISIDHDLATLISPSNVLANSIIIPRRKLKGAKEGDNVVVKIMEWPDADHRNMIGEVTDVLGKSGDNDVEMNTILAQYGLPYKYPKNVEEAAEKISAEITPEDYAEREDFRDTFTCTIDPKDAKDFDDALSIKKLKDGLWEVGVHIADVSEYVKPRSELDKEAYERTTSVYFPDRVIPMLPKELSNGICSLNENEARLTLSCIIEIDKNGEIVNREIYKSVIKSKKRMTYTAVQAILYGDEETKQKYCELVPMIGNMRSLQLVLTKKRAERGSIDLDVKDSHITVNDGKIDVEPQTSLDAYKIIEEFMVLCNEEIAEYLYYLELPCIYRVHEKPSTEKASGFIAFLNTLGITVKWRPEDCRPSDFSAVLKKVGGEPIYPVVNKVMLRSMQKAKYSEQNLGHFGISSKCYCHFTSPIRRYPDLIVHRIVKASLDGDMTALVEKYSTFVAEAAMRSSVNERKADDAERAVDDIYKAAYMSERVGMEYDAVISGVNSSGVFCELENGVEGFTRIGDLPRGNYVYDEKTYSLRSGKRSYSLGEEVRVGVLDANVATKKVDFIILAKKDCKRSAKT